MKSTKIFILFFGCAVMSLTIISAQEPPSADTWIYVTVDDFVHDNRQYAGQYTVTPAKDESPYKDSLKMTYAIERIDGVADSDVSKKIWGIVADGRLYVNNQELNGKKGYSKSFSTGRYHLFFVRVKESPASRDKFNYAKDDVRFYKKEQGKHRGTVSVGGIGVGLGSSTFIILPVIADRVTGSISAYSQTYAAQLGTNYPEVPPVPMNEARGATLIEYIRYLNRSE